MPLTLIIVLALFLLLLVWSLKILQYTVCTQFCVQLINGLVLVGSLIVILVCTAKLPEQSPQCDICEQVVRQVEELIEQNKTEVLLLPSVILSIDPYIYNCEL